MLIDESIYRIEISMINRCAKDAVKVVSKIKKFIT